MVVKKVWNASIPVRYVVLITAAIYMVIVDIETTTSMETLANTVGDKRKAPRDFPSVSERVEYYMGPWFRYRERCSTFHSRERPDMGIKVATTARHKREFVPYQNSSIFVLNFRANRKSLRRKDYFVRAWTDSVHANVDLQEFKYNPEAAPFLIELSSENSRLNALPRFARRRAVYNKTDIDCNFPQPPILWNLDGDALAGVLKRLRARLVTRWEDMKNKTLFLGRSSNTSTINSHLVDAEYLEGELVDDIKQLNSLKAKMSKFKAIAVDGSTVMLAGALYSNSVVLMTWPPKQESWIMESLLQPWVHVVPIKHDFSDLAERTQWVIDHPNESQEISHRATDWIQRLYLDEQISVDYSNRKQVSYYNRHISDQIIHRYQHLFERNTWAKHDQSVSTSSRDQKLEDKILASANTIVREDVKYNISTAMCYKAIFGDVDLHYFIRWAAYNHLLGIDRIFLWYMPSIRNYEGFDKLNRLPYVTMMEIEGARVEEIRRGYEQLSDNNGTNIQFGLERECLTGPASEYDWVTLADADEFLWFDEHIGVKEFLSRHEHFTYLSFGKVIYDRKHEISIDSDSGFGLDKYPFTPGSFCYTEDPKATGRGSSKCPNKQGRCKVMVRPSHHSEILIHGNIDPDPTKGSIQFDTSVAHYKEWPRIFEDMNSTTKSPEDFVVPDDAKLSTHRGGFRSNEEGMLTIQFDNNLHEWFSFVATRSGPKIKITSNV